MKFEIELNKFNRYEKKRGGVILMIKSLYPQFQGWSATGSVYIISDTHFDDADCKLMDSEWITPQEHINIIKQDCEKGIL